MNRASKSGPDSREARPANKDVQPDKQTPNTDMQSEDAGTAASGNADRSTAVSGAMKQTSKTESERGSQR